MINKICPYGEMDITAVFGTVIVGSSPGRCTIIRLMEFNKTIPPFVSYVTNTLQEKGFEVYLVGGSVRDLVMGKTPKDWDVTTNARPEQVQEVFSEYKTVYENDFGIS